MWQYAVVIAAALPLLLHQPASAPAKLGKRATRRHWRIPSSVLSRKSLYIIPVAARNGELGDGKADQGGDGERGCAGGIGAQSQGVDERPSGPVPGAISSCLRLDGLKIEDVAERMGTSMPTVSTWSSRFEQFGLDGLEDKAGRGRKPSIPTKKIERVITEVTRPPKNRKRWSVRSMGRHVGISHSTVQRIWSRSELKPHVTKTFKLSNDPNFEAKFWDVIGLYLDPPANALVLCCDEKSQCQALERTQLGLPLAPNGRAR